MYSGAGAQIIIKQNKYIAFFNKVGAVDAEHAISFDEVISKTGFSRGFVFRKMVQKGLFIQCENEKFYIDNQAAQRFKERRHNRAISILTVFGIFSLVALVLFKIIL